MRLNNVFMLVGASKEPRLSDLEVLGVSQVMDVYARVQAQTDHPVRFEPVFWHRAPLEAYSPAEAA